MTTNETTRTPNAAAPAKKASTTPARPTFRERLEAEPRQQREVRRQVEAVTQWKDWRFLNATGGRCAHCREPFVVNEVILWHVRIRETLHIRCCGVKCPHLAVWTEDQARWQKSCWTPPRRRSGHRDRDADRRLGPRRIVRWLLSPVPANCS